MTISRVVVFTLKNVPVTEGKLQSRWVFVWYAFVLILLDYILRGIFCCSSLVPLHVVWYKYKYNLINLFNSFVYTLSKRWIKRWRRNGAKAKRGIFKQFHFGTQEVKKFMNKNAQNTLDNILTTEQTHTHPQKVLLLWL